MEEKEIVKYDNKYWILEKVSNGMATLWRDGQPSLIPENLIEHRQK